MVEQEAGLVHGTAVLDIQLLNKELTPGKEIRTLHFDITNKGRELSRGVSIEMQARGDSLTVTDQVTQTFEYIEINRTKRVAFPISVLEPGKTTVKLTLTYSDYSGENKREQFSFPITIAAKPAAFKKIENPYIAGPALRSDSPLYMGREDIYRFVDENIIPGGQHHTIVCHGLRRTGKSSLLYRIEKQGFSDKRLIPINIDLQGIADEKDFYLTLSEKILQKLALTTPRPVDDFSRFKRFIKEIIPAGTGKKIVPMLDEFEELQMRVEDNRISRTVFSNIRHLMQHEDNIIFLFCGTHKIEELQADYWSIFFNMALYRRIGRLARPDAVRLIEEPVKDQLYYDPLEPGFSREQAVDTLDKLVTGEILAEKDLNYCFQVNMTRQWIAARHPLRKVRG